MEILVVLQLDAHEIDGNDDPIVTSVYRTHQSKIEIRQTLRTETMHTLASQSSASTVPFDTRKPQIRRHVYVGVETKASGTPRLSGESVTCFHHGADRQEVAEVIVAAGFAKSPEVGRVTPGQLE